MYGAKRGEFRGCRGLFTAPSGGEQTIGLFVRRTTGGTKVLNRLIPNVQGVPTGLGLEILHNKDEISVHICVMLT